MGMCEKLAKEPRTYHSAYGHIWTRIRVQSPSSSFSQFSHPCQRGLSTAVDIFQSPSSCSSHSSDTRSNTISPDSIVKVEGI